MSRGGKIAIWAAAGVPLVLLVTFLLVLDLYRLPSESMVPTHEVGERVVAGRAGFPFGDPGRGDVVILTPPAGALETSDEECGAEQRARQACARPVPGKGDVKFIQRIVALGGERVKIVGGRAHVNGRPLDEPYARLDEACDICTLDREITIPDGHVFLMGDNRGASSDSRVWGPVPKDYVEAKVLFKYWG